MARLRKALLTLVVILGVLAAAGFIWREAAVETAARLALSAQGLDDAQFEVVEVGRSATVIENASLGGELLSARRLLLSYDPAELLAGQVRELVIEGLRLDARDTSDPGLARLIELATAESEQWVRLERIRIEDAEVLPPALAGGRVTIDGEIDLSGAAVGAALEAGLELDRMTGTFTLRSAGLEQGGLVEIAGGGEGELAGMALPGPAGLAATGGRAGFTLSGTGRIPAGDAERAEWWREAELSLAGELRLSAVTAAAAPGSLSADIGWALHGDKGDWRIDLPRPGNVVVAGIGDEALAALRLPAGDGAARDVAAELAAGPFLSWAPVDGGGAADLAAALALELGEASAEIDATARLEHDAGFRLSAPAAIGLRLRASGAALAGPEGTALLRRTEWNAAGTLTPEGAVDLAGPLDAEAGDIRLPEIEADAARISGDARLSGTPERWSLATAPGLALELEGATLPARMRLDTPLRLKMGRLDLSGGETDLRLDMAAEAAAVSGALFQEGGREIAFTDAAGRGTLALALGAGTTGTLRLEEARLLLPGEALGLEAIAATLPLAATGTTAETALSAEIRDTSRPVRFLPARIELAGERTGDALALAGELVSGNGALRLPLTASADLAAITGQIQAGPRRLTFRKGGLQPGSLVPQLAALRGVTGAARVSATAELRADGALRTGARLRLDDLSARLDDLEVAGLAGDLRLSSLSPLATAGRQQLTARELVAGVPIEQTRMRFTILPRRSGIFIRLHEFAGEIAGGQVTIADARWDSTAKSNAFDVQVRDIDLDRLLREWRIEAIAGTGWISGTIPVRVGTRGLAVLHGRLESAGAGVVRVDWGAARPTLMGSGEQVALTVQVLEDFHYKALSVGIDQPEGGALTLAIGLDGANPAVLDGYPFRFNVNLSGQLAPILEAVREGRRIGAELLQGGLGSGG
jgi:hypothetical protein